MDSIESDFDSRRGVLRKGEYQELDHDVLAVISEALALSLI